MSDENLEPKRIETKKGERVVERLKNFGKNILARLKGTEQPNKPEETTIEIDKEPKGEANTGVAEKVGVSSEQEVEQVPDHIRAARERLASETLITNNKEFNAHFGRPEVPEGFDTVEEGVNYYGWAAIHQEEKSVLDTIAQRVEEARSKDTAVIHPDTAVERFKEAAAKGADEFLLAKFGAVVANAEHHLNGEDKKASLKAESPKVEQPKAEAKPSEKKANTPEEKPADRPFKDVDSKDLPKLVVEAFRNGDREKAEQIRAESEQRLVKQREWLRADIAKQREEVKQKYPEGNPTRALLLQHIDEIEEQALRLTTPETKQSQPKPKNAREAFKQGYEKGRQQARGERIRPTSSRPEGRPQSRPASRRNNQQRRSQPAGR